MARAAFVIKRASGARLVLASAHQLMTRVYDTTADLPRRFNYNAVGLVWRDNSGTWTKSVRLHPSGQPIQVLASFGELYPAIKAVEAFHAWQREQRKLKRQAKAAELRAMRAEP